MQINPKATESLADPSEYPNLFEDWQVALTVEKSVASQRYTLSHKLLHFVLEYCLPEIKKIH
jgi:Zn-dependent peptidase ImmA (M78 family)